MKKQLNNLSKYIKAIDKNYIILISIAIIICFPLISRNYVNGHDSLYHIANIDSISEMIKSFNFSKIAPIIANNFGYGGAIFYPKLPHIIGGVFAFLVSFVKMSPIYGINITYLLISILSGILMYKTLKNLFNDRAMSLLGAVLYLSSPYFLNEIYVRGALNEAFMYIFMPMILNGILYLEKNECKKFYFYFTIGYIGMVMSHLVLSVYFTILLLLYLFMNAKKFISKEKIKSVVYSVLTIIIIIMPSMIIMLEHKNTGLYGVFNENIIHATSDAVKNFSLSFTDFFVPKIKAYDNTYCFINIVTVVLSLFGIYNIFFKEEDKKRKMSLIGITLFMIMSLYLSSRYFPYEIIPKLLLSIQFGFRNMTFVCFSIAIIAAYGITKIKKNHKKTLLIICTFISCMIGIMFINETTTLKISSLNSWDKYAGMGAQNEYLTMNALKHKKYFEERKNNIIIKTENKNAKIEIITDKAPYLKFKISGLKQKESLALELPRLYYLGYQINQNSNKIDYNLSKYGFIELKVNQNGIVTVNYKGTTLYNIFRIIRILFISIIIVYYLRKRIMSKSKIIRTEKSR